jgi:hypothetical protein
MRYRDPWPSHAFSVLMNVRMRNWPRTGVLAAVTAAALTGAGSLAGSAAAEVAVADSPAATEPSVAQTPAAGPAPTAEPDPAAPAPDAKAGDPPPQSPATLDQGAQGGTGTGPSSADAPDSSASTGQAPVEGTTAPTPPPSTAAAPAQQVQVVTSAASGKAVAQRLPSRAEPGPGVNPPGPPVTPAHDVRANPRRAPAREPPRPQGHRASPRSALDTARPGAESLTLTSALAKGGSALRLLVDALDSLSGPRPVATIPLLTRPQPSRAAGSMTQKGPDLPSPDPTKPPVGTAGAPSGSGSSSGVPFAAALMALIVGLMRSGLVSRLPAARPLLRPAAYRSLPERPG